MAGIPGAPAKPRTPLSREQVLRAAITLADGSGLEALSMRKLGRVLGVEAMSLYNHVAGKDDLLDGMANLIWSEITLPSPRGDWRAAIRKTAISVYRTLLRHPWVPGLSIASGRVHEARLRYIDAILGRLRKAGLSDALTYHAYHVIDSHIVGFSMWVSGHTMSAGRRDEQATAALLRDLSEELPYLAEHGQQHRNGGGLKGTDEFILVLDFILDGLDRLRADSA